MAYPPSFISQSSDTFKLILDGKKSTDGVNEDPSALALNIYPNPATDKINVTSNIKINHVWVLNNLGAIVIETTANTNQLNLDISGLNPGMYIIKIETDGAVTTRKVMIR